MLNIQLDTLDNTAAAEAIGVSPSTLNTWRSRNKGPKFVRIAGRIRYIKSDVQDWLFAEMNAAA